MLDDEGKLANVREWGAFARTFQSDNTSLGKKVDALRTNQAVRVALIGLHGDMSRLFSTVASKKDNEYRQAKADYASSLKEVDAIIRQYEVRLSSGK